MQRSPVTSQSMFSSQPNLSANSEMNEMNLIKNVNIRKRRNPDTDAVSDLKDSLLLAFKDMLNVEVTEMKQQNLQILASNAEILQLLQTNSAEIKIANEKIESLESKYVTALKRIAELEVQINETQQHRLENTVELRNIPKRTNEDVHQICETLFTKMNIPLHDTSTIYRKGKHNNSPIVIEFSNIKYKDNLLNAVKKFYKNDKNNKLTAEQVGFKGNTDLIYISEALTPTNKKILASARELVKSGQYKYCWVSRGKVLIRKEEGVSAILLKSIDQITELHTS
ncbi:unnamed protein product [Colias eurytheme]|nr:unnamed protein product [Colias eurytheme]